MDRLSPHEIVVMFLALGTLLGCARVLGELAKRFNQPAVLGEILAGILLGPTVLGTWSPDLFNTLFPSHGHLPIAMDGLTTLAVVLFLMVAGMEVDLSTIWRQGRAASIVSVSGVVFPFAVGFAAAWFLPRLLGREPDSDPLVFALFFATALAISALPVIAKTLMDLNLYRTDMGMMVIAAAIFDDLTGWIMFAIILGMIGAGGHGSAIGQTIWMTLAFAGFMLTIGRWLIHRVMPFIQAHTSWPGGVMGFALTGTLFCAALTEWIGIHAIFGAFMFGVALGDSSHLREQTRSTIDRFISFIFAPLFFASIGLKVNFAAHFDWLLVLVVLVIACFGKIIGCGLGARWGGMDWRQAWAVGFGMNARGAMEIILGLLALQAGIIRERLFVALVVMALVTSIISGPVMQRLLREKKAKRFTDYLSGKTFIRPMEATDRWAAIEQLAKAAAQVNALDVERTVNLVIGRERIMGTGVGNMLAMPHARSAQITTPILAVGVSERGVDFDSPDGRPAKLILLILTPISDAGVQLEILADIARTFADSRMVEKALKCGGYTEFLALVKSAAAGEETRKA
ncbi:MAG: cation:proton antiporter domain-containing protein [Phycisphaerales bacterium]